MRLPVTLLFLIAHVPVHAATVRGTVTGIADGDTVYVLAPSRRQVTVRLLGIDAPERGQPYGEVAKQALRRFAHRKPVTLEWHKQDAYGRLLGKVMVQGEDAGLKQVQAGMAWWNRKYAHEQADADAISYREAEYAARKKRLGLWSRDDPIPPWRWRHANKTETDKVRR